ncbi:MAG: MFS transporter [Phenylobacterium sp.]|uniref:MFS transporter n=1 Tax=Phenylobacterium sp. TaxID=1871053 RepID=UPI003565140E
MTAAQQEQAGWADVLAEGRAPRFVLICLGVWLAAADSLVTATIMPAVGASLGGYAWFGWATAGFLLGSVAAGASSRRLAEMFGLRAGVAVTAALYAAGCALSAAAPDMATFLAGRVLQGLGGGWVAGFSSVAVGLLFPDRTLAKVYAAVTAVWGIASLIGPLFGGIFADAGIWRWAFWAFAIQGLAVGLAALWMLPKSDGRGGGAGVPWWQLAVIAGAVAAVGFADAAGHPAGALGLIGLGMALLVLLVRWDARSRVRLLPLASGDLRSPAGAGYATMFLMTVASMGFAIYGPAILQTLHGLSATAAGYVVSAESLAWTVAGLAVTQLSGRWPNRLIVAGVVAAAAGVALSAPAFVLGGIWTVVGAGAVLGGGFGLCWSFMSQKIMVSLPAEERAIGAAAMTTVRLTGAAAGAALAGVAANLVGFDEGLSIASAKAAGLWVALALLPLGLVAVWPARRLAAASPDGPPPL